MTMTIEQFNKIVTKDDLKEAIRESEERLSQKIDKVLTAVDGIARKHQDFDEELTSNQAAHDRLQSEIIKIKERIESKA
ncbi:hypothetical protein A2468_04140 [Candidatus Falkowbacteria bacterium RIFOXYC2_FULL_46_15]|uniref:Uncharacterized protein n=1 Tax=Candidatus Falkowbacteria bacterium RIFOXYA2_FULL_47_19 TaxID=1797994 RepID=A0A1F5SMS0_9BACT|nr:MAG: hypothetical protein A2227_05290 [Candidatus Falkowbacteria bacterium RIFOXYA2_FULL_47_19]OGF35145.1 MAG: hypothetical protein A2468_04140 [Candidatus Falkowbacteria bacterium RIFOXYC2_FULL_46_15]